MDQKPPFQGPPTLIVGLCNPGARYQDTRHNAGAWAAKVLADREGAHFKSESKCGGEVAAFTRDEETIRILKPTTYMNVSGRAVALSSRYFKVAPKRVLIIHDELDLPVGTAKFKFEGGHGGHNGLRDIIHALGTPAFFRLRIGIGRPRAGPVEGYVLGKPVGPERAKIDDSIALAIEHIDDFLNGDWEGSVRSLHNAMNAR